MIEGIRALLRKLRSVSYAPVVSYDHITVNLRPGDARRLAQIADQAYERDDR